MITGIPAAMGNIDPNIIIVESESQQQQQQPQPQQQLQELHIAQPAFPGVQPNGANNEDLGFQADQVSFFLIFICTNRDIEKFYKPNLSLAFLVAQQLYIWLKVLRNYCTVPYLFKFYSISKIVNLDG